MASISGFLHNNFVDFVVLELCSDGSLSFFQKVLRVFLRQFKAGTGVSQILTEEYLFTILLDGQIVLPEN